MKAILHYSATPGLRTAIDTSAPSWLDVEVIEVDDAETFTHSMATCDVLLHVLEPVTAEMIANAPQLQLIQKIGVGVNTIDLDAAATANIAVANMPGTNSRAVAELTIGLMLATLRSIPRLDTAARAGTAWPPDPQVVDAFGEIGGRTVGLIGFGEIPRRITPVLSAMGANVIYTATSPKQDTATRFVALDELLAQSDIVSLHCPLTDETKNMIDATRIATMKPGAILINTARGALVDEQALADALRSGVLSGAGLDVFAVEPAPPDQDLFKLDNVIITPHIAWLTAETLTRSMTVAFDNCLRLRDGNTLQHQII